MKEQKKMQDEYDDLDEQKQAFANPFEAMLAQNQGLDEGAVFELMDPKFEEVYKRIQEAEKTLNFKIRETSIILDKKMDQNSITFDKMKEEINKKQVEIVG